MGEYCLRLVLATLCGTLLGAERSFRRKDAGIRTHSVLALATCLFMLLSKYAFFAAQGGSDPTMIACQVVMGINFLDAGIIFRSKQVVSHWLTTAAGIWGTAAIGMACGCGLLWEAGGFTALILVLNLLVRRYDFAGTVGSPREMKLTVTNSPEIWGVLEELRERYRIHILSSRYKRKGTDVTLTLQVHMKGDIPVGEIIRLLDTYKDIKEFSI